MKCTYDRRGENKITREDAMTIYQSAMKLTNLLVMEKTRYQSYTDYNQVGSWATATTISPKLNLNYAEVAQSKGTTVLS